MYAQWTETRPQSALPSMTSSMEICFDVGAGVCLHHVVVMYVLIVRMDTTENVFGGGAGGVHLSEETPH